MLKGAFKRGTGGGQLLAKAIAKGFLRSVTYLRFRLILCLLILFIRS